ncbi:MAG: tail fiber domain-containing protein [Flavobacterium sp.]|nr:tail fiber domain-containing protein [Flavobacterium sp.]
MKKNCSLVLFLLLLSCVSFAQVGIGVAPPHSSAMLEVNSTVSGVLIPRMTQAQRTAIVSPSTGLLVYQTNGASGFWYYNGTTWTTFGSTGWSLTGDAGTNPTTNFLGTTDNQDFVIATNNNERVRVQADGDVGIGQTNPTTKLHITGTSPVFRYQNGTEAVNKVLTSDANGYATWGVSSVLTSGDNDWVFKSGNTYADPVYHNGKVVIGRTGTTTHHIDIDNGANTGSTMGIGDVEYIEDGNNETRFSHRLVPLYDNSLTLGSTTYRWRTVYAVNGTIQTSDGRDKTNVLPLNYGIKDLMKLNPVSYNWKEEKYLGYVIPEDKKELKLGLIAQEVQKIIPEVVYDSTWLPKSEKERQTYIKVANDYLGINYEELLAVLVKAKQEQQLELEKIQAETNDLLNQIKQLKNN